MAGTVAYVSVSGLLKVFTGAGTLGLMLFSAIEIAKIVATSAIHTYGKKIGWFYNSLLSLAIIISMGITSMGIYGFLSSSYKESFARMENIDNQVLLLETKRNGYQKQLDMLNSEKESITNTIGELSKGLSNNTIQYKDKKTGQIMTTTSSSNRKSLEKQLDIAVIKEKEVNEKTENLNVLIFDLENQILETKLGNESANELSTLKYLADITGKSMDEVMKWFILLLIVIGDPMAILMVIVFNKVVKNDGGKVKDDKPTIKPTNKPTDRLDDNDYFDNNLISMIPLRSSDQNAKMTIKKEESKSDYIEQIQDNIRIDIPINDDTVSDAVNEETVSALPTDAPDGTGLMSSMDVIYDVNENTPEEQIEENIEDVKQLKREPVIPRGKIIESDVVKKRDFSVDVPEPNITRIGTNKEIRDNQNNVIFFKRKRPDELNNED